MSDDRWNRCDVCGRFISFADFDRGASRRLIYPDSEFARETWETLCRQHSDQVPSPQTTQPAGQS